MRSIIYWHPAIYSFFIRLSFKDAYAKRYEAIKDLIENNSSVADICCGDCKIFDYLRDKKVDYLGLDFNPYFIKAVNKRGIKARVFNIQEDEIPKSDYILIQGSLYQFFPKHNQVLQKLFDAATKYLIVSEAIKNYADSKSKIISFIAKMLNNPGDGIKPYRFNINTLKETLEPFRKNIVKEFLASNGMEYIVVMKKDLK